MRACGSPTFTASALRFSFISASLLPLVVLVQRREQRAKVRIAKVHGELHRDHVGGHREHEPGNEDAERDQQDLRLRKQ